jgi:4'-phosphopantetheinyl transferase
MIRWLEAEALARGDFDAMGALVCVVDLDDPSLARLLETPPTARDLEDLATPLAGPRHYFINRRALLRSLIARRLACAPGDVVIGHDVNGAPRVISPDPSIFVSVAARGSIAGLAVSVRPIGVDLEPIEAPREPVWMVLHPQERAEIERQWRDGRDDLFRDIWVAKEAYLKALGVGLKRNPATVCAYILADRFEIEDDLAAGKIHGWIQSRVVGSTRARVGACFAAG